MAKILRYVLVDRNDQEGVEEYDSFDDAVAAADDDHAVIERQYEYSDSELAWTPDGSAVWPPRKNRDRHAAR